MRRLGHLYTLRSDAHLQGQTQLNLSFVCRSPPTSGGHDANQALVLYLIVQMWPRVTQLDLSGLLEILLHHVEEARLVAAHHSSMAPLQIS